MNEESSKERGPSTLRMSLYIILFLFIVIIVFFSWFSPWYFGKEARVMATKAMHAETLKYIKSESDKCGNGETLIMSNTLKCSDMNSKSLIQAAINTWPDTLVGPFKNPYHRLSDDPNAVRSSNSNTNDEDVGYISLSASGSNIIIKSCNKTPCREKENRIQSTVSIE